ncbi:hypothetical protein [Stappia sp. ES.058]|uniref:hypothetical protein n=1 Tax=Stappia sp. ES.058 TaxID=1881061 RepID=UPI000879ED57|nr:hypothetical protein [Stappia sp. ES.058]SDT97066.1 hypothetical protein SAMN05428979_0810 [Stappia sp. ES.058]
MVSDGVLDAMHAALAAASAALAVPELRRNETLDSALEVVEAGASAWANFVDGDVERIDQSLGGGFEYELRQTALVEIVVHAATDAERRAALAAIVNTHVDAIGADPTLGDTVSLWEIVELQRDNLAETGVPNIKGATLTIAAEFIADRPV